MKIFGRKARVSLPGLEQALAQFRPDTDRFADDELGKRVCEQALAALHEGNYGVGALIVERSGEVVIGAHNQVFHPTRHSDLHAEMVALNRFEETLPAADPAQYTLYTSLEPCPMCLARIKLNGIGLVRFLARDDEGGMVHCAHRLPVMWRVLRPEQRFEQARVAPPLSALARQLFECNIEQLRRQLLR